MKASEYADKFNQDVLQSGFDGDQHLDDGEGFARASDGFEDEVAGGLMSPEDGILLLVSHGG